MKFELHYLFLSNSLMTKNPLSTYRNSRVRCSKLKQLTKSNSISGGGVILSNGMDHHVHFISFCLTTTIFISLFCLFEIIHLI